MKRRVLSMLLCLSNSYNKKALHRLRVICSPLMKQ